MFEGWFFNGSCVRVTAHLKTTYGLHILCIYRVMIGALPLCLKFGVGTGRPNHRYFLKTFGDTVWFIVIFLIRR